MAPLMSEQRCPRCWPACAPSTTRAYPARFLSSGIAYAFHPHRDTWYSAPQCQLNWWIPIYPVHPDNAMGFYPRHFEEAVLNSSSTYNYYEWNTNNRATAAQNIKTDTRIQPKAQVPIDKVNLRYLPPAGGIIIFSGAQLHETVENSTGVARYSIDFRSVNIDDARAKQGAPNLDASCTGTTMRDFLRAIDLAIRLGVGDPRGRVGGIIGVLVGEDAVGGDIHYEDGPVVHMQIERRPRRH